MLQPLPVTPRQIARLLANATARVERLRAELATAEKERALFGELLKLHENELLHNQHSSATTIDTMNAVAQVPGQRLGTKHVGAVKMRKIDGSVAKFAAKHGYRSTTVRSWYASGDAARKIPRFMADRLSLAPYRIPTSSWVNGIED